MKKFLKIAILVSITVSMVTAQANLNDCTPGHCTNCKYVTEAEQMCAQCSGSILKITDQVNKLGNCDKESKIQLQNCDIQDPQDATKCLSCELGFYLEDNLCKKGIISKCAKYFRNVSKSLHSAAGQINDRVLDQTMGYKVRETVPDNLECFLCYPGYTPDSKRKSCNRIWFPKTRKCVFHSRGNKPVATKKEFCYQCIDGYFPEYSTEDDTYSCVKDSEMESCSYYGWDNKIKKCKSCERIGGYFAVNSDSKDDQTCVQDADKDWRSKALKKGPFFNGWVILELLGAILLAYIIVKVVLYLKQREDKIEEKQHLRQSYSNVKEIMD